MLYFESSCGSMFLILQYSPHRVCDYRNMPSVVNSCNFLLRVIQRSRLHDNRELLPMFVFEESTPSPSVNCRDNPLHRFTTAT